MQEMKLFPGLKKTFKDQPLSRFCGALVGSYQYMVPQCSILAEIYLLAPIQNAVVERGFSFQNIILTPQRSRIIIKTIGIKVFLKYVKNILAKEEIDTILDNAALMWATSRARRNGAGNI